LGLGWGLGLRQHGVGLRTCGLFVEEARGVGRLQGLGWGLGRVLGLRQYGVGFRDSGLGFRV